MSSEDYEIYREMDKERQERGEKRRKRAESDFAVARDMARAKGWVFKQHTSSHFQLISGDRKIIINVYPGNQRIYQDPKKRGPFLKLPMPWTLQDVVKAATEAVTITT